MSTNPVPVVFTGYMVRGRVERDVLHVEGTTKASRVALNGADHERPVELPLSEVASVRVKRPHPALAWLLNGLVDVRAKDGKRYQLHFRRKQLGDLDRLAAALGA